jgi:hypothetical protein
MMNFTQAQSIATQAYIKAWRECGLKFCPPVGVSTRDKHWSRRLREAWPNMTTVTLSGKGDLAEMKRWCNEHEGSFWHSSGNDKWYFEDRDTAVLFKLTFGGE